MKIEILILIILTILYFNNVNKKKNLKKQKNYLYQADLGQITQTLILKNDKLSNENKTDFKKVNYIKNKNNFYTITTNTGLNKEEDKITIFTDKPHRETLKISLTDGLLQIFKNKNHLYEEIDDNTPNGVLNFYLRNNELVSFPVTFVGCSVPISNSLIKWIREEIDIHPVDMDHHNHLSKEEKDKLRIIYDKFKIKHSDKSFEEILNNFVNKNQLRDYYGDNFMDNLLRQCKIKFKLMNINDQIKLDNLLNNNYYEILKINSFIDSECPFWKAAACLSTKGLVLASTIEEFGPIEVAMAVSKFAAKDILERLVRAFIHNSSASNIVNLIIACTPLTPLCIVNPIINHIYGCTC